MIPPEWTRIDRARVWPSVSVRLRVLSSVDVGKANCQRCTVVLRDPEQVFELRRAATLTLLSLLEGCNDPDRPKLMVQIINFNNVKDILDSAWKSGKVSIPSHSPSHPNDHPIPLPIPFHCPSHPILLCMPAQCPNPFLPGGFSGNEIFFCEGPPLGTAKDRP